MAQLTVQGVGTFSVPDGKRLVLALTDEAAIDQLHKCGGNARCTTCRVQFVTGEPDTCTAAEQAVLMNSGLLSTPGLRLSCQLLCDHDMAVQAISRQSGSSFPDRGARPADSITPPPQWLKGKPQDAKPA